MGFHNTALIGASGQGGDYNLESSLRFRSSAGAYLERTFGVPTDPKKYTISVWVKRGVLGGYQNIISAFDGVTTYTGSILFAPDNTLGCYMGGAAANAIITTQVFRDPSAWYHIVFSVDAANTTCSLQVNGGTAITASVANVATQINANGRTVRIGDYFNGAVPYHFDGYLTEFNFIDGQALDADDFGSYDDTTGVWKPKEYLGTYGTNGFYLPFTGEITPSVTAGFGGTAENVLYDDTAYLVTNTTTGSGFDLVEYDFGESINMIDYNIQDFRFTGGVSTFKIYTSDVGGSLSNYTERASLSVSSSYQNYSGNLGVTARYIKIRATAFGTNGQGQINYFNVDVDSSIFSDNSGNVNNWTPNNINVVADMMNDVPTLTDEDTANFATWNPLTKESSIITTNANLSFNATTTSGNHRLIRASHGMTSGKYYWEVNVNNSSNVDIVGVSSMDFNGNPLNNYVGGHSASAGYGYNTSNGNWYGNGFTINGATPPAFPSSGIIGVAFDADNGELYFHRNGTWINSANPSAGTGSNFTASTTQSGYLPAISTYNNQGTWTVNFGQIPFAYTPPTGYLKLNTYNLPDSTIVDGSEYMNTVLYTGNGTSQSITSVGFSPDLVWVKSRNTASYWHNLVDTVRGNTKYLFSNDTTGETTQTTYLTSFDSDGFSIGSNANWNNSGTTYVTWNWRGSDSSPVSNTAGTITSTVSANTDSGFSIVTGTMPASGGFTVGHGLGVVPDMYIFKRTTNASGWGIWHKGLSGGTYYLLFSTAAQVNDSTVFSASPTNEVLNIGSAWPSGGQDFVAYCFAEVEGFSKIGSYIGNGSTDGPFVYTGFRPAFILWKRTNSTSSWAIWDTSRSTYNAANDVLFPDINDAESSGNSAYDVDLLSNGFKWRTSNATINGSGSTYIYMAFAENPFKNSLAR